MHLVVVHRDIIVGFYDAILAMDNSSRELGEVYALYGYKRKKLGYQLLQMADKVSQRSRLITIYHLGFRAKQNSL